MKCMLASKFDHGKLGLPLFGQPKLNGVRAYMKWDKNRERITIASRNQVIYSNETLAHIAKCMDQVPTELILDGELYKHGWPLQRINAAVNRKKPSEDSAKLEFWVFDCLIRDNKGATFAERLMRTRVLSYPVGAKVQTVFTQELTSYDEADHFHFMCTARGYEGSMYRVGNNPYLQGHRSNQLLKRKDFLDEDCEILGLNEGEGKYKGSTGAFLCKFPTNEQEFTVGSGLTDKDRDDLWKRRDSIRGYVKVKYEALSVDGYPLKPIVLGYELRESTNG